MTRDMRIAMLDLTDMAESQLKSDLVAAGYKIPGWYFMDETDTLHGPFATRHEATLANKTAQNEKEMEKEKKEGTEGSSSGA